MTKTAAILVIGNEVLSGKVRDENGAFLMRELRRLGVDVQRVVILPDAAAAIGDEVAACAARYDFIFTTGGIGPTHDDVTIAGIARGLGRRVVRHPQLTELVRTFIGAGLNEAALKNSEVPEGASLLMEEGLTFPVLVVENIYVLPGVPEVAHRKFLAIRHRFQDRSYFLRKIHVSAREEEIAHHLSGLLLDFPTLLLGSYPVGRYDDPQIVLTLESKDSDYLESAFNRLVALLPTDRIRETE